MVPGSPSTRGALATAMNDPSMHPSIDFVRWFEIIYIYIQPPKKPEISQMIYRYKQIFMRTTSVPSATRKMKRPTVLAEEFLDINGAPLNPKLHGSRIRDVNV